MTSFIRLAGFALALTLPVALCAQAPFSPYGPGSFSADMIVHAAGHTMQMSMAKRGPKVRVTLPMPGAYQLILPAQKTVYVVMPMAHMCMRHPMNGLPPASVLAMAQQQHAQITDLGPATITVAGHSYACEHHHIVFTPKPGTTYTIDAYNAKQLLNFPVKYVMRAQGKTSTVEFENIKLTPPAATLFTPPAHCSAMPDAMHQHGSINFPGRP